MADKVEVGIRAITYFILMCVAAASAYSTPDYIRLGFSLAVLAVIVAATEYRRDDNHYEPPELDSS